MPRAVDPSLFGQQLPITHSPLNRIGYQNRKPDFSIEDIIAQLEQFCVDFLFPAIKNLTGIDLGLFLPLLDLMNLDFSSVGAFLSSLIQAILTLPSVVLELLLGLIQSLFELTGIDLKIFFDLLALFNLDFSGPVAFLVSLMNAFLNLPEIVLEILAKITEELTELTGINLNVFLPLFRDLDLSSPIAFFTSLTNAILATGAGLLGPDSPLNAANLFGILDGRLFSNVPIGALTDIVFNLLPFGGFPIDAIAEAEGWFTDLGVTASPDSTGSAKIGANGIEHALRGIPISIGPDKTVDISTQVQWAGFSGIGSPIQLGVLLLKNGVEIGQSLIAAIPASGTSSGWTALSGTYTAPADGSVDTIRPRLILGSGATAGTVWFDDAVIEQPGQILEEWVSDLIPQLEGLAGLFGLGSIFDLIDIDFVAVWTALTGLLNPLELFQDILSRFNIDEMINIIIESVEGIPWVGGTLVDMLEAMNEIFDTALDGQALGTSATADLAALTSDLLSIPNTVIGTLSQSKISNLTSDLADRVLETGFESFGDFKDRLWNEFLGTSGASGKTNTQVAAAFDDFFEVVADGPAAWTNLTTHQTELTQTMQVLMGQTVTAINLRIQEIKDWYSAQTWTPW
jgi:hypothetical protein